MMAGEVKDQDITGLHSNGYFNDTLPQGSLSFS